MHAMACPPPRWADHLPLNSLDACNGSPPPTAFPALGPTACLCTSSRLRAEQFGTVVPLSLCVLRSELAIYAIDDISDGCVRTAPVPREITHIVLEIGCNGHNWLWNNILPVPVPGIAANVPIANQSHVLLISFEPLLDKYALYLSHQKRLDALRGNLVVERPFSPGDSKLGLYQDSSITVDTRNWMQRTRVQKYFSVTINSSKARGTFSRWSFGMSMCGQAVSTRRVPVVSLETVLQRWLPGRRIAFIKIDAQGYDVYAARSAGLALNRIDAIQIEMTADK
ncbi:hypothetical protein AB1Y20_013529 [Prymnesium parvum]|uniref:Methyltransferase FkbM domain-containing protein n=1 Tax=Prymnesium parvum TaxID=97485 RepID=A0AB34IHQ6_PRYPA